MAVPKQALEITILNLNFSGQSCNFLNTHPNSRIDTILAYIVKQFESGSDVIVLQEGRNCDGTPTMQEWLGRLPSNIGSIIKPYGENVEKYSFYLVTLYNRNRVTLEGMLHSIYDSPKRDRSFLATCFNKKGVVYTVVNTHLSMVEDEKDAAIRDLISTFGKSKHIFICGDLNFFMDQRGGQQIEELMRTFVHRSGHNIALTDGTALQGSYIGWFYDKQKKLDKEKLSALLNVFSSADMVPIFAFVPDSTVELLKNWLKWNANEKTDEPAPYFSDHLSITVRF